MYKAYSDSYLTSLTKVEIIELLRVAEHNFFVTEEALNNSEKAGIEIAEKFDKAKELLKMAMKDMKILYESGKDEGCIGIEFKWRYADEALKLIGDKPNGI
jgi:hypothetical protein